MASLIDTLIQMGFPRLLEASWQALRFFWFSFPRFSVFTRLILINIIKLSVAKCVLFLGHGRSYE